MFKFQFLKIISEVSCFTFFVSCLSIFFVWICKLEFVITLQMSTDLFLGTSFLDSLLSRLVVFCKSLNFESFSHVYPLKKCQSYAYTFKELAYVYTLKCASHKCTHYKKALFLCTHLKKHLSCVHSKKSVRHMYTHFKNVLAIYVHITKSVSHISTN